MAGRPLSTQSALTQMTEHTHTTSSSANKVDSIPPAHKDWTAYAGPVRFTGPSGLRDHRVNTQHEFQMVGEKDRSSEITSQMGYLNRPPPGATFPKAKNGRPGEIGWLYDTFNIVHGI